MEVFGGAVGHIRGSTRIAFHGRRCASQQCPDLVVRQLLEVEVPGTDREEVFGRVEAHQAIGCDAKAIARPSRRNRNRHDNLSRALRPQRCNGRQRSGTGSRAVVDDDDAPISQLRPRKIPPEAPGTALDLRPLALSDPIKHPARQAELGNEARIEVLGATAGDGSQRQFLVARSAELANDKDVQRSAKPTRHFDANRYAAPRQRKDDWVAKSRQAADSPGKQPASFTAILEGRQEAQPIGHAARVADAQPTGKGHLTGMA
jgi:hypothetical protein